MKIYCIYHPDEIQSILNAVGLKWVSSAITSVSVMFDLFCFRLDFNILHGDDFQHKSYCKIFHLVKFLKLKSALNRIRIESCWKSENSGTPFQGDG